MIYHRRPSWFLPEKASTPESVFLNRRHFIAGMGAIGGAVLAGKGARAATAEDEFLPKPTINEAYKDAGREITSEKVNTTYNNFYEFGSHKKISRKAQKLNTDGWTIKIDGLVEKEMEISTDDLIKMMPIEERVYRHRCVEAWSMVAPWIGFPLAALVKHAAPLSGAKYVQFESFNDPKVAPGQKASWYPWPYTEGLTIEEATNDLPLMVVGAYGKVLHKQFGAPVRLHLPWKLGFKSIKSVTRITFTDKQPVSYWEQLQNKEYGFWANVNPEVPHPRWSQATERVLGGEGRIPTVKWNGYGEEVAGLYAGMEEKLGDRLYR